MDNQLISLIEKIVEEKLKEMQPMTREPATVLSSDNENGTARVRFLSGSEYELLNKTGEVLSEGDSAWVEYRTLPSAGYIAMRNGKAVGLYEKDIKSMGDNAVQKFRTSVLTANRGEVNVYASTSRHEFKVTDIPTRTAIGGEYIAMHLGFKYAQEGSSYKNRLYRFNMKINGSTVNSRYPVWIGNEAYIQFPPSYSDVIELYVEIDSSYTGWVQFNYDIFRINQVSNRYSVPPCEYEKYADSNNEAGGVISYSEFVRYVCEELTSAKQRLDALEGQ